MPERRDKRPSICPFWRKVSVIPQEEGCTLMALCGRKLNEKRPPPLKDFRRRNKCPLFGDHASEEAYVIPAIYKQKFADPTLRVPLSNLIVVRTSLDRGEDGIEDLENRWQGFVEDIRSS